MEGLGLAQSGTTEAASHRISGQIDHLNLQVLVMSSPDPTHLRDELVQLLDLQLRVLEKQVFGVVTKSELREYERRHTRICWLYDQLFKRKAAAA